MPRRFAPAFRFPPGSVARAKGDTMIGKPYAYVLGQLVHWGFDSEDDDERFHDACALEDFKPDEEAWWWIQVNIDAAACARIVAAITERSALAPALQAADAGLAPALGDQP
jgi:hypothetical protein